MRGLKDRTVLITGGANGIGAAIARRLGEEGCTVGILDLDADAAGKVVAEIRSAGGKASLHAADISDYSAVTRAIEDFEKTAGPIALLVNNAGWDRAANFLDTTPEFWAKVVGINLYGPLNVSHIVLKGMAARGFGRVVNIASDAGRVGSSGEAVYSACKGGMIAFGKTVARELVGKGIIVNTLCPGPDRHRDPAQLPGRPGRHPHRRGPQARHSDAAARRAGGLPGVGRLLSLRRCRLHHRPDHQRVRRPHHAWMNDGPLQGHSA